MSCDVRAWLQRFIDVDRYADDGEGTAVVITERSEMNDDDDDDDDDDINNNERMEKKTS